MGWFQWLAAACVLFQTALAGAPYCPPGYGVSGPYLDWCCLGVCPRWHPWTNSEDLCALSIHSHWTNRWGWPPVCPRAVNVATGVSYDVYTFGRNDQGQLGIDLFGHHETLAKPTHIEALAGNNALLVAAGYQHTIVITYSYQVYAWGNNDNGQLGIGGETDQPVPIRVNELTGLKIRLIAAGGYHSCAVDKWGNLYTWGANNHGQLGRPESRPDFPLPVPNLRYRSIKRVALGLLHSCAITRDLDLYCWGAGFGFQLGHNATRDEDEPRLVRHLQGVPLQDVSCGCEHTVAIATNRTVFVWGKNKYGELGLGDTKPRPVPTYMTFLDPANVEQIETGCHHTAAVTESGGVYIWGWNAMGQLGLGDTEDRHKPSWVNRDDFARDRVFKVSLGYGHTVLMTKRRKVYAWGYGDFGQLGLGDDHNRTRAFQLYSFAGTVMKVEAGGYHTAVIAEEMVHGNIPNPDYSPVDDPKQSGVGMKLKFLGGVEKQEGDYKESIRIHVTPGLDAQQDKAESLLMQSNLQSQVALGSRSRQDEIGAGADDEEADLESARAAGEIPDGDVDEPEADADGPQSTAQQRETYAAENDPDSGKPAEGEGEISSAESGRLVRHSNEGGSASTTLGESVVSSESLKESGVDGVVVQETPGSRKLSVATIPTPPSPSPRPLPPMDRRAAITMRKEVIPTRDQLYVDFNADHRTMESVKSYEHAILPAQAQMFQNRNTRLQAHHYHHRKNWVDMDDEAHRNLHSGDVVSGVDLGSLDNGMGLKEPSAHLRLQPESESSGVSRVSSYPVADDDAPLLRGAVGSVQSGPVIDELPGFD